jgi:D-xylose transport system permease protein
MLMVIVTGQIDLSVGSVVGLCGGIAAIAQGWLGWGLVPSLIAGVGAGVVIGLVQGSLVAYLNIPAFIVTLGGYLAWRGVILGLSRGETIPLRLQTFKSIGQDYIGPGVGWGLAGLAVAAIIWMNLARSRGRKRHGLSVPGPGKLLATILGPSAVVIGFIYMMNSYAGIPTPVLILLVVALSGAFLTQNTTFGRYLYAIGGNPDAARLSGINLQKHVLAVFAIIGALAGVAAIIYTARVGSASPDAGQLLELDAIAACVIGGTSLMGGRGTVFGAILGALIMASLDNGMSLKNVEPYMQNIIKGAILVAAVGLDMAGRRRS